MTILEIDDKIISTEILTECFACDLSVCRGDCCVEGNAGAPLDIEEIDTLEEEWDNYSPYMTEAGRRVIENEGFMVVDSDGDYTTPLIGDADCAYAFRENGVTYCAIERAWFEGKTPFRKPISCHLYPIRVKKFSNGTIGMEYHRWDICNCARECGKKMGVKIYQALREPIIRAYGENFYNELDKAAKFIEENEE